VEVLPRSVPRRGVPFLAERFGTVGIRASVDLLDDGRSAPFCASGRRSWPRQNENLARIADDVELRVRTAYKVERTRQMVAVSEELLALRTESRRVVAELLTNGGALGSQAKDSDAKELEARAALLKAQLDYVQSADAKDAAIGRRPR
jgi:hypothetical protein